MRKGTFVAEGCGITWAITEDPSINVAAQREWIHLSASPITKPARKACSGEVVQGERRLRAERVGEEAWLQ